ERAATRPRSRRSRRGFEERLIPADDRRHLDALCRLLDPEARAARRAFLDGVGELRFEFGRAIHLALQTRAGRRAAAEREHQSRVPKGGDYLGFQIVQRQTLAADLM